MDYTQLIELLKDADAEAVMTTAILEYATDAIEDLQALVATLQYEVDAIEPIKAERDALQARVTELQDRLDCDRAILEARTQSMNAALAKLKELEAQEPYCYHWVDRWGCNHYADPKESIGPNATALYARPIPAATDARTYMDGYTDGKAWALEQAAKVADNADCLQNSTFAGVAAEIRKLKEGL